MVGRLEGKVAIVTGGASGMGAASVRRFTAEGARVLITDIQDDKGQALARELGAMYKHHDVAQEPHWKDVMATVQEAYGRLDIMLNNAGIVTQFNIETETLENWHKVIDTDLTSVMLGCQNAIRVMKENPEGPKGAIINISSIGGFVGMPDSLAYTAAKGGVRLMSKAVAVHCARMGYNIRSNTIHPGTIETPIVTGAIEAGPDQDMMRKIFENLQPVGRMGQPEEIASMATYLASDEAEFVNGTELIVDGAMIAGLPPIRMD